MYCTYLYIIYTVYERAREMCSFLRSSSGGIVHNIIVQQYEIYYNSWSPLWPTPLNRDAKCGYTVLRALLCRHNIPKNQYYIIIYLYCVYMYTILYCGCGNARLRTSSVLRRTSLRQTKKKKISRLVGMNTNAVTIMIVVRNLN